MEGLGNKYKEPKKEHNRSPLRFVHDEDTKGRDNLNWMIPAHKDVFQEDLLHMQVFPWKSMLRVMRVQTHCIYVACLACAPNLTYFCECVRATPIISL